MVVLDHIGNSVGREAAADSASPGGGAFRIYARDADRRIRIITCSDPEPTSDARLVQVEWFADEEIAMAVATYCAELLVQARMAADEDGWHPLPVIHLPNLLNAAKAVLHVTIAPESAPPTRGPRPWTGERIARLGVLAGQGWTAKAIADDPLIMSTAGNVYRQAHRWGISLSEVPHGQITLRLPPVTTAAIDRLAASSGLVRDAYLRRWIIASVGRRIESGQPAAC